MDKESVVLSRLGRNNADCSSGIQKGDIVLSPKGAMGAGIPFLNPRMVRWIGLFIRKLIRR